MDSKTARGLGWHLLRVGSAVLVMGMGLLAYDTYDSNQAKIEAFLYPVFKDWTADSWTKTDDGYWTVHVTTNKLRGECVYDLDQAGTGLVRTELAPVGREVLVDRTTALKPGGVRPPGEQDMGVWTIESRVLEVGNTVTFSMRHTCGDSKVVTIIGPFTVGYTYPDNKLEPGFKDPRN